MNGQPGSGWRVVGQSQATDLDAENRFVDGLRITFQTGAGHTGSVFVPLATASPETVYAAISERAATMDQIANLTHDSGS